MILKKAKPQALRLIVFFAFFAWFFTGWPRIYHQQEKLKEAQATGIAQYSGGLLVYADDTVGTPKYKIYDDVTGFGIEQSASSVGASAIQWIRVAASPTANQWIIATRDAGNVIKAQVCDGVDGGVSCGTPTQITATGGTHGFRNFDVAYEQLSGDALLVYGNATVDMLRKIEYTGGAWVNDAQVTTTRTSAAVEWVELTARPGTNQIGVAYSDAADDVSGYRWNGTAMADEATAAITTSAPIGDTRKFDVSFEGSSGDMLIASMVAGAGTLAYGALSGTTWTISTDTAPDVATQFLDMQEPNPSDDDIAIETHGTLTSSNTTEGFEWNGSGVTDGNNGDDLAQVWAANYQLGAVAYASSTYYGVAVFSSAVAGEQSDDIAWWTMAANGSISDQANNARSRGNARFIHLYDFPNADKVLLLTSDANSDLWADTWNATAPGANSWVDLTSGGALEIALSTATKDPVDFAFRLAPDTTSPAPNPMTFASAPSNDSASQISMTATTATDVDSPSITYFFTNDNTNCGANAGAGGTSSAWQAGTTYSDSGLDANKCYGYTVKARDSASTPNETTASAASTTYTSANTPGAPTLGSATSSTLNLTNSENGNSVSNPTTNFAVQVVTTSPSDSNWSNKWVDASGNPSATAVWLSDAALDAMVLNGLTSSTLYGAKVKARNQDNEETVLSSEGQGTTSSAGTLSVDIVDGSGNPVGSPSVSMNSTQVSLAYQTATGTFGTASQKVRVNNTTANPAWTLTIAASAPTAVWAGTSHNYDFNDPTANAGDGGDSDSVGGQMTLTASSGTIAPQGGCSNTGLTASGSSSFSQGVTDSVTLVVAGASAGTGCYWDITSVPISQTIPKEQPVDNYSINLVLSITAN